MNSYYFLEKCPADGTNTFYWQWETRIDVIRNTDISATMFELVGSYNELVYHVIRNGLPYSSMRLFSVWAMDFGTDMVFQRHAMVDKFGIEAFVLDTLRLFERKPNNLSPSVTIDPQAVWNLAPTVSIFKPQVSEWSDCGGTGDGGEIIFTRLDPHKWLDKWNRRNS